MIIHIQIIKSAYIKTHELVDHNIDYGAILYVSFDETDNNLTVAKNVKLIMKAKIFGRGSQSLKNEDFWIIIIPTKLNDSKNNILREQIETIDESENNNNLLKNFTLLIEQERDKVISFHPNNILKCEIHAVGPLNYII
ncbi:hypothetical protein CDIK_0648 [Cucumispora dikerogammari]|nr:hypothetical protein CDIK_0648 [Cucumispora dikerogammari]